MVQGPCLTLLQQLQQLTNKQSPSPMRRLSVQDKASLDLRVGPQTVVSHEGKAQLAQASSHAKTGRQSSGGGRHFLRLR